MSKRLKRCLPIPYLLIIMGMVEAYVYMLYQCYNKRGVYMGRAEIVAIVVAIIGAATGIWAQVVQFKKDGTTIRDIKIDTTDIRPTVHHTQEDIKKIKDELIEKIVPDMKKMQGIDLLVDDYKYRERIRLENSINFNKETLQGSIDLIFEENARLTESLKEAQKTNYLLQMENQNLRNQLKSYEREVSNDWEQ